VEWDTLQRLIPFVQAADCSAEECQVVSPLFQLYVALLDLFCLSSSLVSTAFSCTREINSRSYIHDWEAGILNARFAIVDVCNVVLASRRNSRDSAVGFVTRLRTGRSGSRSTAGARSFFVFQNF
jgi:hypothetical protein